MKNQYLNLQIHMEQFTEMQVMIALIIKKQLYSALVDRYRTISGAERNSEYGKGILKEIHQLGLEISELEYRPVWIILLYINGKIFSQSVTNNLNGVYWNEITIDFPDMKVDYVKAGEDVYISLLYLLSFDEYQLLKAGKYIFSKTI